MSDAGGVNLDGFGLVRDVNGSALHDMRQKIPKINLRKTFTLNTSFFSMHSDPTAFACLCARAMIMAMFTASTTTRSNPSTGRALGLCAGPKFGSDRGSTSMS